MPYSVPPPDLPPVIEVVSSQEFNQATLSQVSDPAWVALPGQPFSMPAKSRRLVQQAGSQRSSSTNPSASSGGGEAAIPATANMAAPTAPAVSAATATSQSVPVVRTNRSSPPVTPTNAGVAPEVAQVPPVSSNQWASRSADQAPNRTAPRTLPFAAEATGGNGTAAIAPPTLSSQRPSAVSASLLGMPVTLQEAIAPVPTIVPHLSGGPSVVAPSSFPVESRSRSDSRQVEQFAAQLQFLEGRQLGGASTALEYYYSAVPATPVFAPLARPRSEDQAPTLASVFMAGAAIPSAQPEAESAVAEDGREEEAIAAANLEEAVLGGDDLFPALTGLANHQFARSTARNLAQTSPSQQTPVTPSDDNQQLLIIPGTSEPAPSDPPAAPQAPVTPETPAAPAIPLPPATTPSAVGEPLEINADFQEYDNLRQVFSARGRVVMRFRQAVLRADQLQVNLPNRVAVAEGNVSLVRGQQEIRGDRFVYNFVQEQGRVTNARGEVFIPQAEADLSLETSTLQTGAPQQVITRPPGGVVVGQPGLRFNLGGGLGQIFDLGEQASGELRRIRFEAEQIDFTPDGWQATNVRLTNDPFSPPELELRSRFVTFTRETETRSVLRARNPRLVFDDGLNLPLLQDRVVIDPERRDAFGLANIRFDDDELGGLYLQRTFSIVDTPQFRFSATPRILVQRAIDNDFNFLDGSSYGLLTRVSWNLSPTTSLVGSLTLNSLDFREFEDNTRSSLRVRQVINDHLLNLEYSYRDRLFNGSLGFQDVRSSIGAVLTSPNYQLGDTGISLNYQFGAQYITARSDFDDLIQNSEDDLVDLTRIQGSAFLGRGFRLWQGEALPPTPAEGLRFTPAPLTPFLDLFTGVRSVYSYYSSGDTQATLQGTIGLRGQFGNFSRNFLDYTSFNLSYTQTLLDGLSPFFFDRVVDQQVINAGIVQQIYGPIRLGFQTSYSLDNNDEIDTNIVLEYQRRTYSIAIIYNPVRQVGAVTLSINDFNWSDFQQPFSGLESP